MVRLRDSWRFNLSSDPTAGNPRRPLQPESVSLGIVPRESILVGHSVRSSVLCGPVSCREVDDVATTNESVARLECGGADGVDAVEPVAGYAGGSGRAGGGVAGGCRRAELHSRRAEGRTPR